MAHRCSVLIVDDDAELREVLRVALDADGYDAAVAGNGREALDHLRSTSGTCAILLDLMMPVMDGAAFRSVQLRDRSLAWIPIVVVSGADDADEKARQLGATSVVRKPFDLDCVQQTVRALGCARDHPAAWAPRVKI